MLTGFFGVDADGGVVLFGRGGSDHSAGAVAAAMGAARLELWKDVAGYLNADPGVVASARTVPELSFAEARQLADLGSPVLHPGCLAPLAGLAIETSVRSFDGPGTRLVASRFGDDSQVEVAVVVSRPGWVELGLDVVALRDDVGRRVLRTLRDAGVETLEVRQHDTTLWLTLGAEQLEAARRALQATLDGRYCEVAAKSFPPLVGAVGDGVGERIEVAEKLLDGLRRTGVRSLRPWPGVGTAGVAVAVHPGDRLRALSRAFETFFGHTEPG